MWHLKKNTINYKSKHSNNKTTKFNKICFKNIIAYFAILLFATKIYKRLIANYLKVVKNLCKHKLTPESLEIYTTELNLERESYRHLRGNVARVFD